MFCLLAFISNLYYILRVRFDIGCANVYNLISMLEVEFKQSPPNSLQCFGLYQISAL